LFYEPDLSRPAYDRNYYQELGVRFTIKAAEKPAEGTAPEPAAARAEDPRT